MDVCSSTTQTAAAIRSGHLSATDVLEAHLAQIDERNPALNAVVTIDAERALERARAADEALARGEVWGPLHHTSPRQGGSPADLVNRASSLGALGDNALRPAAAPAEMTRGRRCLANPPLAARRGAAPR